MSWLSCPLCHFQATYQVDLSGPTCLGCTVPVVWSQMSCPYPIVLSRLSCPSYPVPVALPRQSCPQLSWRRCHVLAVLTFLSFPGSPVEVVRLTCSECPVLAALSRLSCPSGPVPDVLSQRPQLSCPKCPVLATCSGRSASVSYPGCTIHTVFSGCPVPAILCKHSCPNCLSRLPCHDCLIQAVLCQLSCTAVLSRALLMVLSCCCCVVLAYPFCSVQSHLSSWPVRLTCLDWPVPAVLSYRSCPQCSTYPDWPATVVPSPLSCLSCPALAVILWPSCHLFPFLAVLS
jgi:hypothetical protein